MNEKLLSLSIDLAKEYIVKIAVIEFPFLALPVVNQLFNFFVDRLLSRIEAEGILHLQFNAIDEENEKKLEEYNKALKNLEDAKSEEEKNEALKEAKSRLGDLIKFSRK
jgi:glycyl-tRNA synthetase beta subunit